MSTFPFSSEEIARHAALSAIVNSPGAPPPLPGPIPVDDHGWALVPIPATVQDVWAPVYAGILLQWAPVDTKGALLSLWGGPPDPASEERRGLISFLTPNGLRSFAADLVAIADTLEASS